MNKTGLSLPVVFLLTIPRCFHCFSSSLFFLSVISYVAFVVSLFVPHLSLGLLCHCGISWISSLIFIAYAHIYQDR